MQQGRPYKDQVDNFFDLLFGNRVFHCCRSHAHVANLNVSNICSTFNIQNAQKGSSTSQGWAIRDGTNSFDLACSTAALSTILNRARRESKRSRWSTKCTFDCAFDWWWMMAKITHRPYRFFKSLYTQQICLDALRGGICTNTKVSACLNTTYCHLLLLRNMQENISHRPFKWMWYLKNTRWTSAIGPCLLQDFLAAAMPVWSMTSLVSWSVWWSFRQAFCLLQWMLDRMGVLLWP